MMDIKSLYWSITRGKSSNSRRKLPKKLEARNMLNTRKGTGKETIEARNQEK